METPLSLPHVSLTNHESSGDVGHRGKLDLLEIEVFIFVRAQTTHSSTRQSRATADTWSPRDISRGFDLNDVFDMDNGHVRNFSGHPPTTTVAPGRATGNAVLLDINAGEQHIGPDSFLRVSGGMIREWIKKIHSLPSLPIRAQQRIERAHR